MKRLFALLLSILICAGGFCFAESDLEDAAEMTMNEEELSLELNDSDQYSVVEGGYVQVAFDVTTDTQYIMLYLTFPETVQAGDIISTETSLESGDDLSGVIVYVITSASEYYGNDETNYGMATQSSAAYPEDAVYSIQIDEIETTSETITIAGTVTGSLTELDATFAETGNTYEIEASFQFTLEGEFDTSDAEDNSDAQEA